MSDATTTTSKSMDDIVALCKRRGFIFPASEIYGGINGFWDYGPLGIELKNNLRDAWWHDMVRCPPAGPEGRPLEMVGLDSAIIQNPRVWQASGHVAGFNDPMVDDKETKGRFRADQLFALFVSPSADAPPLADAIERLKAGELALAPLATFVADNEHQVVDSILRSQKSIKPYTVTPASAAAGGCGTTGTLDLKDHSGQVRPARVVQITPDIMQGLYEQFPSPFTGKTGVLTAPRMFNLMFETYVGAVRDEESKAYLRPETAQGIFLNYKNVLDTMRVKVPFGIAQIGKAFRNEVTPRNFIFRSREFEQMEMEWFCPPDETQKWFEFWCDQRVAWWRSVGLSEASLAVRPHEADELSHYARGGAGTVDVEFRFPFTDPNFAELEGIAHRTDFDLAAHQEHARLKLEYFDQERNARYVPHVVEPAAGLTRGVLAVICEAYTPDPARPSKVYLRFHPRLAPIQAAVFPLVAKNGMPEVAEKLYDDLRGPFATRFDVKQSIGKRYARMDESGTPYCFTIDGQTLEDQSVTVRDRDTAGQERINLGQVNAFLAEKTRRMGLG
ncbi:MAG: glycine--tRNA ligase [Planctomycetota bacterium]|jgi:glycyl-tRNA synthetase